MCSTSKHECFDETLYVKGHSWPGPPMRFQFRTPDVVADSWLTPDSNYESLGC